MVEEIRIYVEGGGDNKKTWNRLRKGFGAFFKDIIEKLRKKKIKWEIIACGPRNAAYSDFCIALNNDPHAFNILLVDSEDPVTDTPWRHLKNQDGWDNPGVDDENCHLMVQMMEAWFVADIETLKEYYGQEFKKNTFPKIKKVEKIEKTRLETALKTATSKTQKGEYHKTKHGFDILGRLDVKKVRKAAYHCERLFKTLEEKIGEC